MDVDLPKEKQLRKMFFMKFKDILMLNQETDVKPESKAAPCRYLNGKMYNVNGDMYKLQIYFKRPFNAESTLLADEVENVFMRR